MSKSCHLCSHSLDQHISRVCLLCDCVWHPPLRTRDELCRMAYKLLFEKYCISHKQAMAAFGMKTTVNGLGEDDIPRVVDEKAAAMGLVERKPLGD